MTRTNREVQNILILIARRGRRHRTLRVRPRLRVPPDRGPARLTNIYIYIYIYILYIIHSYLYYIHVHIYIYIHIIIVIIIIIMIIYLTGLVLGGDPAA